MLLCILVSQFITTMQTSSYSFTLTYSIGVKFRGIHE